MGSDELRSATKVQPVHAFPELAPCDAVLFDLDGVLIDSTSCIVRHWTAWAAEHGLDLNQVMQIAHGIRAVETIRLVAPHLDAEEEARQFTAHEVADTDGVVALPGAHGALAGLAPDRWAIVTSASFELAKARLGRAGLPIPGVLVTADDVSQGKPAPDPYLLGARRLRVPAERCVVIEDAPAGVEAGKRAGMPVIGLATTHKREDLLAKGADKVVENLEDLPLCGVLRGFLLAIQAR